MVPARLAALATAGALLCLAVPPVAAHESTTGQGTLAVTWQYSSPLGLDASPRTLRGTDFLGGSRLVLDCDFGTSSGLTWAGALRFPQPPTGAGEYESLLTGIGQVSFPTVSGPAGTIEMDMPGGAKYVGQRAVFSAAGTGDYIRSQNVMDVVLRLTSITVDPDGDGTLPAVSCPDATLIARMAGATHPLPPEADVAVNVEDLLDVVSGGGPRKGFDGVRRIHFAGAFTLNDRH